MDGWTVVSYKKTPKPKKVINDTEYEQFNYDSKPIKKSNIVNKNSVDRKIAKVANDTENFSVKKFGTIGKTISSARLAKKMTQKELANKLSIQVNLLQTIENGSAVYDGNLYSKIKNFLHI